jgi:nitroreductase
MIHKLKWRYATKQFDPEKKLEEDQVTELLKMMNLSASSYGLQPYKFIIVKNQELQEKLKEAAYGQSQLGDASHIIILAAKLETTAEDIDAYIQNIAQTRHQDVSELQGYGDMMKGAIGSWTQEQQLVWAQKQAYIALGTLLIAAADAKIDACPMEGFDADAFDEILGLQKKGLRTTVIAPIGIRSVHDKYQHEKKVRRALGEMVDLYYD